MVFTQVSRALTKAGAGVISKPSLVPCLASDVGCPLRPEVMAGRSTCNLFMWPRLPHSIAAGCKKQASQEDYHLL